VSRRGVLLELACALFLWVNAEIAVAQEIRDSGYVGRTVKFQDIYWVDNYQVLFVGRKPGVASHQQGGSAMARNWIHLWNLRTGKVEDHDESNGDIQKLCYRSAFSWREAPQRGVPIEQGYVRYEFIRGERSYVRFGRLFAERESELDIQKVRDGVLRVSPLSCKEFKPAQIKSKFGANLLPLLDEGEYLDRSTQGGSSPQSMRYFPANGKRPITLEKIPTASVIPFPRYSEFARKYVFVEQRTQFGPNEKQKLWQLDRNGRTEKFEVFPGPWMQGSTDAMPIKTGLFVTSTAATNRAGGGFEIVGEKVSKLIAGLPLSFAVSPDGCTVAISITAWGAVDSSAPSIKVIHVCSTGVKNGAQ